MTAQAAEGRVSLLLPNRNNEAILEHVLQRLAMHTTYADVEVVAVDDGSTDASLEILRRWAAGDGFEHFRLIEKEHSGVVETLNMGLEAATGEYVVQLDADASVETRDWIQRMLAFITLDERVGVVTAKVVIEDGYLHTCGLNMVSPEGLHDRFTTITEPVGRRKWHERVKRLREGETLGAEDRPAEVDAGMGCCMMYRRADALAVGGYDMGYSPVWFDDSDLCLMLRREGKKVFYTPDVRVVHYLHARRREPVQQSTGAAAVAKRGLRRARVGVGAVLSPEARIAATRALGLDKPPPDRRERLAHHYAYFRTKWGWDMLNPDMGEVRRRWGQTEICWATDEERRAVGEEIVAAYDARRGAVVQGAGLDAAVRYGKRYGFLPPPPWSSLMRYQHMLDVIRERGLHELGGDAVEIGVLLGGGVYQLARLFERLAPERKVIGIDIFATAVDDTLNEQGRTMQDIYDGLLEGHDQREVYDLVVAGCPNVVTVAGDSATVELPTDAIAFAHIDGNHSAEYVRKDFDRMWERLLPGGIIAFDDYDGDLPEVTETVDALRREHAADIADFFKRGEKTGFLQRRR